MIGDNDEVEWFGDRRRLSGAAGDCFCIMVVVLVSMVVATTVVHMMISLAE